MTMRFLWDNSWWGRRQLSTMLTCREVPWQSFISNQALKHYIHYLTWWTWFLNQSECLILIFTSKNYTKCYIVLFPLKGSDDVFAVKGCDGDAIALDCSRSAYTINILHASYGSYPYSCGQQYTSTKCPVLDVKSKTVTKCQDYKECHFSLNGSLFGYSCPNDPARP